MNVILYKKPTLSQKMVYRCECRDVIINQVPVADICEIIREYSAELDVDKLNSAIDRSKKFEFSNELGAHLVIKYADGQLYFARSNGMIIRLRYKCTIYCDTDSVPYLLQDSDTMDVICTWARELTTDKLKNYLAELGMRLDNALHTCHT